MDLQTRKLNLIGYLISIEDENIFSKIETSIIGIRKPNKAVLKPLTQKELIDRANLTENDYREGKYISQEQLEMDSENW